VQCPFLKEAQVDTCRHAVASKLIVRSPETAALERCSSQRYLTCPVYRAEPCEPPQGTSGCPFFAHSLVQFCGAAAVRKYIPYSEAGPSRCGTAAYRYCDLYLSLAHPDVPDLPDWLWYATNHMWLDASEDGFCHVGIDSLLAEALGEVERVHLIGSGLCRPAAVVTVRGVDVQLVFPNVLQITASNVYLRVNPSKVTSDPYRLGWMFEGRVPAGSDPRSGLICGSQARQWMDSEIEGVSRFVHEQMARAHCVVADGGAISRDFARYLDRDRVLELFHRFFSPWTK
jgi:glycine cleavage system H lipoate-binding protein